MKKTAQFLVDRRKGIFLFMMCLAVVSVILIPRVNVNTDMTRYLPESSAMKQGIDLLAQEFSGLSMPNTVRVMFRDVPEEEKEAVRAKLKETPHVQSGFRWDTTLLKCRWRKIILCQNTRGSMT